MGLVDRSESKAILGDLFYYPTLSLKKGGVSVNLQIFIIRVALGAFFAVILSRFFYPEANIFYVAGLGVILVGLAYLAEYLRHRRKP